MSKNSVASGLKISMDEMTPQEKREMAKLIRANTSKFYAALEKQAKRKAEKSGDK